MRRYVTIPLLIAIILGTGIMLGGKDFAMASVQTSTGELKITQVNDIEVYNNYEINTITIDNGIYPNYETKSFKFTLERDGFVKILLTADKLSKITYTGSKQTVQEPILTATVYRDDKMLYAVIPTITAKASINSAKASVHGETRDKVALDKGTYYVSIKTDKYQGVNSTTYVRGLADFILYYQPVISDEFHRPSSVGQENPITPDKAFQGLLTVANPRDYYSFELKERSLVNLKYMYESSNRAKFVLYGKDWDARLTKQFTGSNVMNKEELVLEAGKYYISLESVTVGDGGRTSIEINSMPYPLELKQVNRTKNSYIRVDTIEVPKEVRFLRGKMTQSDIDNSKWRTAELITDQLQFGVNKTGNYSVRVVDDKGNMFIESIRITSCDTTAPAKPKIKGYMEGSFEVTGTAEANSLVTVIYNSRQYISNADSKGNYSAVLNARLAKGAKVEIFARDISGNVSISAVATVK